MTNQKKKQAEIDAKNRAIKKEMERRRRAKPPPYNMLKDIMDKFNIKKPKFMDWGPGGLYGHTREELEEMERLANRTPSSHRSSIQREMFKEWKLFLRA